MNKNNLFYKFLCDIMKKGIERKGEGIVSLTNIDRKNLDTLNKVIKTVNLNSLDNVPKDSTGVYLPIVNRGDIVFCDFIGIGTEIDEPHYAIVWEAPKNKEAITVIPVTSAVIQEDKSQFCIGQVEGFITQAGMTVPRDTYVYLNKIKEVSRKRFEVWYKRDSQGNIIWQNNHKVHVSISSAQIERIQDAIRVSYLDCPTLLDLLIDKINRGMQFPVNYGSEKILQYGYRAVADYNIDTSIEGNYKLKFAMYDGTSGTIELKSQRINPSIQSLCNNDLVKYDKNVLNFRKNVIKGLFSNNVAKVNCAKSIISELIRTNANMSVDVENTTKI